MTHTTTRKATTRRVAGVATALALTLFTACGNDKSSSESGRNDVPAPADTSGAVDDNSTSGGAPTDSASTGLNELPPSVAIPAVNELVISDPSRKLIITMTVGIEVTQAAAAVDKVIALAARHGGQ